MVTAPLFLVPSGSLDDALTTIRLNGPEGRHAADVQRLRPGEEVLLSDGQGRIATCTIAQAHPGALDLEIRSVRAVAEPSPRFVLVQALAKNDRDDQAVEAATELGVDEIVPWQAQRSVSRWEGPKAAKGRERWAGIVREAAKQAHRAYVPAVTEVCDAARLAARADRQRVLVLDPTAETALSGISADERDIVLVVGPEGGITPEELTVFTQAGAERVRLGGTVLRTSTAGPAAIAVLSGILGRW